MPTCAELNKKIEELEARFSDNLNKLVEQLVVKVQVKLQDAGLDVGGMRKEVSEMAGSLQLLNDVVEKARSQQMELFTSNKALKNENEALRKRVAELEQYSRLNNVEIKGVPCTQGEDCVAVMAAIGEKVECPVSPTDLDIVHRVPTKNGQQNIIARFCSRDKKNEFVKKARKARLDTRALGFSGQHMQSVFVNEHLSPENKRLFSKALTLKKEKGWLFLWTDNCHIKARQNTASRVFRIASDSDLSIFT